MAQAASLLVVDASVAARWYLPEEDEEHADLALALIARFRAGSIVLLAPEHIRFEVPSAITVAAIGSRQRLTAEQAQSAIDAFLAMPLLTFDDAALLSAAFPLAIRYGIAFYDAVYLALAQRERAPLITADRKCYSRISHLPEVIWPGAWQA